MQKAHDATKNDYWRNKPLTTSPINQDNLNRMEVTMDVIDDRVVTFDTTKANQSDLLLTVKTITYTPSTGTFTFTHWNGSTTVINTDIEKIAINFDYDDDPTSPHYQHLVIELDDGTYKYVDMSALITQYEFVDGTIIDFTVAADGSVSADIKDGSITGAKLQPNFLADCLAAKAAAELAASNAEADALVSEGWAKGTQNGTPVGPGSPYYEDNAEYWKEQAEAAAGGYSSLASLTDTNINNPANDQLLVFDSVTGKWKNGTPSSGVSRLQSLDFVGKTTTFNSDGSISVVADDYSEDITFNSDGSITEEVTINGVTTTKTTTFVGNTIVETIT